jgi:hypothetical protein
VVLPDYFALFECKPVVLLHAPESLINFVEWPDVKFLQSRLELARLRKQIRAHCPDN